MLQLKPSKAEFRRVRAELQQKKKLPWSVFDVLFPYQTKCHNDVTSDRVLTGTRQLGKSRFAASEIIDAGLASPGCDIAYVDMDILHGERIIWKEIGELLRQRNVAAEIIDGVLKFENGSTAYIFSGRPAEIEKLQGFKLALLIVDEAQEAENLEGIIKLVRPALMRFSGRIILLGIPGRIAKVGYWWDVTEGKSAHKFGQHRATFWMNPAIPEKSKHEQFETAKAELGETNPEFIRHWLGKWPANDNALRAFRYDPDVNGYDGEAPVCRFAALGLDPGGTFDAEAVEVIGHGNKNARGDEDGIIWQLDEDVSEKKEGGDWDITGERVGKLDEKWAPTKKFLDYGSARKSGVIVKYKLDTLITLEAVPPKDPEQEAVRINLLFQAKRLFIRRGSKLHYDLLYTTLDHKELAKEKWILSKTWKQNSIDALRAALWGVPGYATLAPTVSLRKTDEQREKEAIAKIHASGPKADNIYSAAERILGLNRQTKSPSDAMNLKPNGRPSPQNGYGTFGKS